MVPPADDGPPRVAFATTTDVGPLAEQAVLLARSVRATHPDAPLVVYLPSDADGELDPDRRAELERLATVEVGPYPIPDYPISAQLRAFEIAAERFGARYTVMLDTDVLVLRRVHLPETDAPLLARQASVSTNFWTTPGEAPGAAWQDVYDRSGVPEPDVALRGAIDGQPIRPFWNAGVVATSDPTLPSELLEVTGGLVERPPAGVAEAFFNDQIALAVLAARHGIYTLPVEYNFPLLGRLRVPDDVVVLHYNERRLLRRLWNPRMRDRVAEVASIDPGLPTPRTLVHAALVYGSAQSGRLMSYETAERVRALVGRTTHT
jgi:hypothetical protein